MKTKSKNKIDEKSQTNTNNNNNRHVFLNRHFNHKRFNNLIINSLFLTLVLFISICNICDAVVSARPAGAPGDDKSVIESYTLPNRSVNFTHVVYDRNSSLIYVGASNWLYQFSDNLTLEVGVQTGPVRDSPLCSPNDCNGVEENIPLVNNINKVLVIDGANRVLIACGSVRQGSCQRHRLADIAQSDAMVSVPVVSNDENSSTVALVAPAKYLGPLSTPVLYVAATNSRLGAYRDMVPAISSRFLESGSRLFHIIEKSFSDTARVDIASHLRDYYLVRYVHAFHTTDFVYFATVQRRSHLRALEEWGYVTRLARVCQSDPSYNTYTEVSLQCAGGDGTDYTLLQDAVIVSAGEDLASDLHVDVGAKVFVGVFATAVEHTSNPSHRSALCVYSMEEIENKFTQNIHMCYNGSTLTRNMDYIAGNLPDCPTPGKGPNIVSFCNEIIKLNGSQPIVNSPAIVYENSTLTAVTALSTGQHTVAFVGTRTGQLKKLLISTSTLAEEFEEVTIDAGNAILSDLIIDKTDQFVYVSSPFKISKIAIERCAQHNSCRDCLQARNPYCGWCSLQKSCTLRGECPQQDHKSSTSSSRWLSLDTQQCIDFQSIKPESLPITSTDKVELVINQLPKLPHNAHYQCVFGEGPAIDAQTTKSGLICRTPPVSWRPQTPLGSDHILVNLSVRSSETKTDFLHRKFAFYDCNSHKTCMDCVQSEWQCNWCSNDNKCIDNKQNCSPIISNDMFAPTLDASQQTLNTINDQKFCPSFDLNKNILLPNGVPKEIILPVKNMPNSNSTFRCVVDIEGSKHLVSARVEDKHIVCSETAYSYRTEVGQLVASVTVMWNGDTFIDRANVTVYKCHLLGAHNGRADCSLCLTLAPDYKCQFCSGQCAYGQTCGAESVANVCPAPRIDWMHPLSGPIAGGTLVTIEGSNLGTDLDEIRDKIFVGGQPCIPVAYSVSVRVTCRTGAVSEPQLADVVVGNRAGITAARDKFRYEIPELVSSHPNIGPQSGGTRIYITGTHLNIGSTLEIYLDHFECIVDKMFVSSSQISCRTTASRVGSHVVRALIVRVDNQTLTLARPFRYVPDPTILRIYPLKSYLSGGRTVTIIGTNLEAVQQPRLAVFGSDNSVLNESACHVMSSSQMVCPSPPVSAHSADVLYREQLDAASLIATINDNNNFFSDDIRLRIGFIMDAVNSVKELATNFPTVHSDLGYVPDPKFFAFEDSVKLYKGESLVIEGENLRLASTESEVNVTIGSQACNLTSLAQTQLVCLPPEVQPDGTDEIGRRTPLALPLVVVRVGASLRYEIGHLQYEVIKTSELPPVAIVVITVSSLSLILFVLISLAVMRHKSSQAEREYKRIQMQMDTLENSVRSECKQAFAELQTDMTDLTNDLESMGIPTLDHRTYVMKVFFPGLSDHPLYQCARIRTPGAYNIYELAMTQFEQLLNNKHFLIAFIYSLENSKTFSIRDRVNVASLLMVILMERMEYATDVLRTLLHQLVDRSVCAKHPHLMLRRTESVVEKMLTNWLALSMYDYVREQAGSQLFLLFSAIKRQVEKGPIDAVTHDARYSLSEERLLREHYCDYEQIVIQVFQESENEKLLCRVNDCDSISQVKAKLLDALYKNTPFSLRPAIHDVDLEWRHGRGGHLILQDEDLTTKSEHGWQRINSLRHYGVKSWAVMSLVMRQTSDASFLSCSTRTSLSPIIHHRSNPFISSDVDTDRYWHLIKPSDASDSADTKDTALLHKAIPEIFLTRLLSTKGTVQKFVDDFFHTILSANESLPAAVKWVFDLLDSAAAKHQILDPEVLHAWKSNCLPLRFWVNFIKNPDFILDVHKTSTIDSSLSVIAQTLMDSCSMNEHRLGKDSPSNKLLFAKDIPNYKQMVNRFYGDVSRLPTVTDQDLSAVMQCLSLTHTGEFDVVCALKELFVYSVKYNNEIMDSLQRDPNTQHSVQKFANLINYKF